MNSAIVENQDFKRLIQFFKKHFLRFLGLNLVTYIRCFLAREFKRFITLTINILLSLFRVKKNKREVFSVCLWFVYDRYDHD